ncbi:MAG: DUF6259 domain-containing protein [Opitutaceae bacterium]|jgi:hypothetical protein
MSFIFFPSLPRLMAGATLALALSLAPGFAQPAADNVELKGPQWEARFQQGMLNNLRDRAGRTLVSPDGQTYPVAMSARLNGKSAKDAKINLALEVDKASGDLVVVQNAETATPGLEWAEWTIGYIPLEYNIIVPGGGGDTFTRNSPFKSKNYTYPMSWDAQLLVIEGAGHGFYLWGDDTQARFKSISIERTDLGWKITCRTINEAPFTPHTRLEARRWRINTYEGDWRVPARRYRDWAESSFHVKPLDRRNPEWVKDMRVFLTILRMDTALLDEYARQLDPKQTLIYLSQWRKQQFDRDTPNYDQFNKEALPFIKRAHELGFHVMLHVNFWGVTPENPLMQELAPYQVRNDQGVPMRYQNLNQKPPLYLNYISPASARWREEFVGRMKKLVELSGTDAIHFDQNFHSHNDMNGRIDGLTFNEGLLRYFEEMRTALPGVAFGGEGLNELTYRSMDFAQRHVWSVMGGTIDRAALSVSHPISSYLFSPYVRHYGWLGLPFPHEKPQVYAGWRENYINWGIYPTIRHEWEISPITVQNPAGFLRQLLTEAKFFQQHHLDPDLDSTWPADMAYPFLTDDGRQVAWMKDRSFKMGGTEISRTLVDISSTDLPGTIDGWLLYNDKQIFGLKPDQFYAYHPEPRDQTRTHITAVPAGFAPDRARLTDDFLFVTFRQQEKTVADLIDLLPSAASGVRLFDGQNLAGQGVVADKHGALLRGSSGVLSMTPPAQGELSTDLESTAANTAKGLGEVYATYTVTVPAAGHPWFLSSVAMDGRAVRTKKSDGMVFTVTASDGAKTISQTAQAKDDTRVPLNLDLSAFSGLQVRLELTGNSGPAHDATEDRGVCYAPRIVTLDGTGGGSLAVAGAPAGWTSATTSTASVTVKTTDKETLLPLPPSAHFALLGKHDALSITAGQDLAALQKTVTLLDLWDGALQEGKLRSSVDADASGFVVTLPVRTKAVIDWQLALPDQPLVFSSQVLQTVGSGGVGPLRAKLAVNDEVLQSLAVPMGKDPAPFTVDLSKFAGQRVVLSLILEGKIHGWVNYKMDVRQPVLRSATP